MTVMTKTNPTTIGTRSVADFVSQLPTILSQWRLRRRTEHMLNRLDDHTLKDIGLRRDQFGRVLRP